MGMPLEMPLWVPPGWLVRVRSLERGMLNLEAGDDGAGRVMGVAQLGDAVLRLLGGVRVRAADREELVDAGDGLARRAPATARRGLDAVLPEVGPVGVARARVEVGVAAATVAGPLILVGDGQEGVPSSRHPLCPSG